MPCITISDANPDIAGIGVVLAFGLQALVSLLLSIAAKLLERPRTLDDFLGLASVENYAATVRHLINDIDHYGSQSTTTKNAFVQLKKAVDALMEEGSSEGGGRSKPATWPLKEVTKYKMKQQSICSILLVASDAQTMTGIALIISAMAQKGSLSIYHMHLIYDTINFTAVSNFAAVCCAYDNRLAAQRVRYISMAVFGIFYIAFTIMFGIRLNEWNDRIPGQCFNASRIALSNARHPYVDQIYLGVTSFWVFALLLAATVYCRFESMRSYWQKRILFISSSQFILHLYMVIALRVSNQSLLKDASLEEAWGFGQVLALVIFGSTLVECAKGLEGVTISTPVGSPRAIVLISTGYYSRSKDERNGKASIADKSDRIELNRRTTLP